MTVGLLVLFPLLNFFRYQDTSKVIGKLALGNTLFSSVNMDTYQSLVLAVKYDIITYGYQLLGVVFFFIPRSLWSSKPEGSGRIIANEANYVWDNVSANYFAEGFMNFGVLGLVLFALILGRIIKNLDAIFFEPRTFGLSLPLVALMPFIYRGDLMSSFSYTIAYITACLCLFRIRSAS